MAGKDHRYGGVRQKPSPVENHGEGAEFQEVETVNAGLDSFNQLDKS